MSQPQQLCGYRRSGIEDGVTYVHEDYAKTLVTSESIDEILGIHRSGETSVTTVLEYSAKRGRAKVTQALVAEGVTVTREAINAAARLGGPGVALLLAGLKGDALDMARHDALHAWLLYGHFSRAMDLLEDGVSPSAECYKALEVGAKREGDNDWTTRCHRLLDVMLPITPVEHFSDDVLGMILNAGRPVHIERLLEILRQPPLYLFGPAMRHKAHNAVVTLRQLGLRMSNDSFTHVATDLCRRSLAARIDIDLLLEMYVQDSGQGMTACVAEPLLLALLRDREWTLRRISGPNDGSYQRARDALLPIMRCMDASEHLKLFETIDRWAAASSATQMVPVTVTAVLKHTIHATNRVAMTQLAGERTPR